MSDTEEITDDQAKGEHVSAVAFSDILKPTLHDHDFLQSFVRIGLDETSSEVNGNAKPVCDEKQLKRYCQFEFLKIINHF